MTRNRRGRRGPRRLALAASIVLLVAVVSGRAGAVLVVAVPVTSPDAIVALASHEWERLPAAARMAHTHPAATILLTVPQTVTPYNCHDCANRVERLAALGVEQQRIRLVTLSSAGTHGEALAVRDFARAQRIERLLIVTSPYHTRRAIRVFEKVFEGSGIVLGVEPAAADSVAQPGRWWMGGYDRAYVGYEWAGLIYYALKYGVSPLL